MMEWVGRREFAPGKLSSIKLSTQVLFVTMASNNNNSNYNCPGNK
jgi:hypothetical protein